MTDCGTIEQNAIQYLHPILQQWIFEQGWTDLRPIQHLTIPAILHTAEDWIISAPTASGKTEAAFLPVLSTLLEDPKPGLRTLCLCPTKSLVDDLHLRITPMANAAGIAINRLHGDVPTRERRLPPKGILITTPESLELLLLRPHAQTTFQNLRFAVIDELHALSNNERGIQTLSLLHRIETLINNQVPRIGLSATLSQPLLRPGSQTQILCEQGTKAFSTEWWTMPDNEIPQALRKGFSNSKSIVFANTRGLAEDLADRLSELSKADATREFHFVHHSSISATIRRKNEARLRDPDQPSMAICARTLELGIDIGDIDAIVQIGPAPSVAALRQRIGRSGRRDNPSRLVQIQLPDFLPQRNDPVRPIRPDLLQTLATISLAEEGWVEPTESPSPHLSTLVQQIACILASTDHGIFPDQLFDLLCQTGPFRRVTRPLFDEVIQSLQAHQILRLDAEHLNPNPVGFAQLQKEGLVTAFQAPPTLKALSGGQHIGDLTLNQSHQIGERLNLGGRRWEISSLNLPNKTIELVPGPDRRKAHFDSNGVPIHRQIHQRMREILESTAIPCYLDEAGRQALKSARKSYQPCPLYRQSENAGWIFHWSGDRVAQTLVALLEKQGVPSFVDGPAVRYSTTTDNLHKALTNIANQNPNQPANLLKTGIPTAKFDNYLPEPLLRWEQERVRFDVTNAIQVAQLALQSDSE